MNKQRYLAELSRLLGFATDEDRQNVLNNITKLFDEAGPEGEDSVISQLGSPVQLAIKLSRSYTPSAPQGGLDIPAAPQPASEAPEAQVEAAPEADEASPAPAEASADLSPEPEPVETFEIETVEISEGQLADRMRSRRAHKEPSEHKGFAMASLVMLTAAGVLPLCAVLLCAVLAALTLGLGGIAAGVALSSAGAMSLTVIADALMLFGIALVCFGLGIFFVWLAIWAAVSLVRVLASGIPALFRIVKGASEI